MDSALQVAYAAARLAAWVRPRDRVLPALPVRAAEPGISLVIPSRNGRDLLAAQMPGIARELPAAGEILVVDNGSGDGTAEWLRGAWPQVRVDVSPAPLSFARAVNRGVVAARYSRVCLLNNDMQLDPGFFPALQRAFDQVPDLFCATAQIRFPPGVRREETGKAVMAQDQPDDFPVRCDEPVPGEDLTYVLYGSGGCSLYDAAKLRSLGGVDQTFEPAYVEDLDLGYRAWQRGWPSVYVAGAQVEHRHRATTSRYYSSAELDTILEINYLKFLVRSVASARTFRRLWAQALRRLGLRAGRDVPARTALRQAPGIVLAGGPPAFCEISEDAILALTNGTVSVFPGRPPAGRPRVLLEGASLRALADRIHRLAQACDPIVVALTDAASPPPPDLLASCVEIVLVRRSPSAALSFRAAAQQTARKWGL